jgi:hypothetical protein
VDARLGQTQMKLREKQVTLDGYSMREVRRLTSCGHRTSIITNNRVLTVTSIACYMFGRIQTAAKYFQRK